MSLQKFTQYSELYYGLRVPASVRTAAKVRTSGHNYSGIHKYTKLATFLKTGAFRKLSSGYKRNRGRTLGGTTTVYTKSSVSKKLFVSYAKTTNSFCGLSMTVGVEKDVLTFKMAALIMSMDASLRFVPMTKKMGLFRLMVAAKIARHAIKKGANYRLYEHRFCDLISMLKSKEPASFVPVRCKDAPTLARSAGEAVVVVSRARAVKKTTVIVKLPSDQIKLIDSLSMVMLGSIVVARKLVFKNTKAGYWRNLGYKPMTRGVVKNPVDHPHGGRERTILWPRTPWGKSTK